MKHTIRITIATLALAFAAACAHNEPPPPVKPVVTEKYKATGK